MKIVDDQPGRRLELVETGSRYSLPVLLGGLLLTALVAAPWRGLWAMLVHGAGREALDLVGSAIWAGGGLVLLASAFSGPRLEALCADRDAGRLHWRRSRALGLLRWSGGWKLDGLDGLTLACSVPAPGTRLRGPLRLLLRRTGASAHGIDFRVDGLESREQAADFALRLAAAAGLAFHRVALNEADRFAMELHAQPAPGLAPVPVLDASRVAARAAATPQLALFEPERFSGDARVSVWAPGREVSFDKRPRLSLLLSPLLLGVLLGPLSLRLPGLQAAPLLPRIVGVVMITLVGLAIALVGWAGLQAGLPRHVRFDWTRQRLRLETLRRRREIAFSEIAEVELRRVSYSTGRASGGMVRTSYWAQVRVGLRPPSDPADEGLIETRSFRNDAASPQRMALPLARELAAALGVPVRETSRS